MWPVCVAGIILIDTQFLHLYNDIIHKILLLISITPLAANMVVFATQLKTHPEKASFAVLLSTLFALFYIPLMVTIFF
jgi:predicted permease